MTGPEPDQPATDDEAGDPAAIDTGDFAAVPPDEQADADDPAHPENVNEAVDVSDVTDDGEIVDVTGDDGEVA